MDRDDRRKQPPDPATGATRPGGDEREPVDEAPDRNPNHPAIIRLVVGVLIAAALVAWWRWLS